MTLLISKSYQCIANYYTIVMLDTIKTLANPIDENLANDMVELKNIYSKES